jgi:predicted Zn-dependent protease
VREASLTSASNLKVGRDDYLNRINGITFGDDPRKGYFNGSVFSHPDLKFRLTFPEGWTTHNGVSAVVAMSPEKDAAVELTLVEDDTPSNLASEFFTQPGMIADAPSTEPVNGLPAAMARFELAKGGGVLTGRALFITLGETTYRILGYGSAEQEPYHAEAMLRSLLSFRRLTDRAALAVQAATVRTVAIGQPMTIEDFYEHYPSSVPLETVALINGTNPGTRLATGTRLKQVRGGKLPD